MWKPSIHADGSAGRQAVSRSDEHESLSAADVEHRLVAAPRDHVEQPLAKPELSPPAVFDHAERAVQEVRARGKCEPPQVQAEDPRLQHRQQDGRYSERELTANDRRRIETIVNRAAAHEPALLTSKGWLRS